MSSNISNQWSKEGWQQIQAGVALIVWSRLARWNWQNLILVPTNKSEFESPAGHIEIHKEFGRLICWIAFSVGSEYLAKGACLLNDRDLSKPQNVIRPPLIDENIENWIRLVNYEEQKVRESDKSFGTLNNLPLKKILKTDKDRDFVFASYKLLGSFIRNRDAHRYTRDVRDFHFYAVESLFVPAFNILLKTLDQNDLRDHINDIGA